MRVTNIMTSNQLLLNLNKNMNTLNFLQYQSSTGNKIRYASDNPIIAGRSLKFRTNIVEVEQYISNVSQGRSWLQTSANAVKNVMEAMVNSGENSIRSLLVSAGGVNTVDDSKIYANQLKETLNEILGELNTSYAGRYVFSGYKTDEKPVFDVDNSKTVQITQSFDLGEIDEDYRIYTKADELAMPTEISCIRLKLAYETGINPSAINITGVAAADIENYASINAIPYPVDDDKVYFIEDSGELLFGKTVYNDLSSAYGTIDVTYTKTGFNAGELNPKAYFKCVENGVSSEIDGQFIKYEFGINNKMQVNSLAKDILTTDLVNDIKDVISLIEGTNVSDKNELIKKFQAEGIADGLTTEQALKQAEERAAQQLKDENKFYTDMFGTKFTQLIGKLDNHATYLSQENTSIGSRLSRLDLIENRLQDDRVNFEDLKSENDLVDAEEVYIRFQSMLSVYTSALQTGANVIQMSLINYI